jgi:hypothetical protein
MEKQMSEATTATDETGIVHINENATFPVRLRGDALELDLCDSKSRDLWRHFSTGTFLELQDRNGARRDVMPVADAGTQLLHFDIPEDCDPTQPMTLRMHPDDTREPIAQFTRQGDALMPTQKHGIYQLTVDETRGLGRDLNPPTLIPYPRAAREGYDPEIHAPITDLHTHVSSQIGAADLFELAYREDERLARIEDSPEGKDKMSARISYPEELLDKLGVLWKANDKNTILNRVNDGSNLIYAKSYFFSPTQHEGLKCEQELGKEQYAATKLAPSYHDGKMTSAGMNPEQRRAVVRAMDAGEDETKSFNQVEEDIYRHTTPLIRDPHLTKLVLRRIAESYAAQGIQYAELATSSMLDPNWLEQMVEAVDEIEHGTKNPDGTRNNDAILVNGNPMTMRFLVGLPRRSTPTKTLIALERMKFLMQHPYIVGIDLMGSETNRTSDFHWALSNMAMWARSNGDGQFNPNQGWNFKEDTIIRIHAGETAKNPRNVAYTVRIADEHRVRTRAGHAQVAQLDKEEESLLQYMQKHEGGHDPITTERYPNDWFAFEKCPSSNPFYRMKPLVHQVVIKPHSDMAHSVLGQDGNGLAHTSPRQLAFAALTTQDSKTKQPFTLDDLAKMRRYEEGYIDRAMERDARKARAFAAKYPEGFAQFAQAYREFDPKAVIAKRFEGKKPLLIGGASDSSWKSMDELSKAKISRMIELLVQVLDPQKTYFVLGRVEGEGVSKVFDRAIKRYNLAHPTNKFNIMARYGHNGAEGPTGELAETISGFESIRGGMDGVADSHIDYLREKDGKALFFDGAQFTSEMIQNASDHARGKGRVPFAAFISGDNELLQQTTSVFQPDKQMNGPEDLLTRILRDTGPDKFFKSEEERDRLLQPGVAINDHNYCQHLLADVDALLSAQRKQGHAGRAKTARTTS